MGVNDSAWRAARINRLRVATDRPAILVEIDKKAADVGTKMGRLREQRLTREAEICGTEIAVANQPNKGKTKATLEIGRQSEWLPFPLWFLSCAETAVRFGRTLLCMSKKSKLEADELERRIWQLREIVTKMSMDELCELIRMIEAVRRERTQIDTIF